MPGVAPHVRRRVVATALLTVGLGARGSSAQPVEQPPPLALTWSAPPGCPSRESVGAWVRDHLGAAANPAGYPGVVVDGVVTRQGADWHLRLRVDRDGFSAQRALSGPTCEELARSAALVLAIVLEPTLGRADPPPEPAGTPPPTEAEPPPAQERPDLPPPGPVGAPPPSGAEPPPAAPERAVAPEAAAPERAVAPEAATLDDAGAPARTPKRPHGHALRVAAGFEGGLLPGPGGGLHLAYALRLPVLRFELAGSLWPARRRDAAAPGVGATALLGAVAVRVCPTPHLRGPRPGVPGPRTPRLLEFPLCLGVELGALDVRAFGFSDARAVRALWAAAQVQPGVAWRFSRRLALWGGVALVVPFNRATFTIEPEPTLFRVGAVGVRAELGLEVHLGRDVPRKNSDGSPRRR
ncbi:hypothetical protein [Nannocystis punicea]|uniref:Uncharacterized protein n=1 Tax=Nannocystis punicea TaxID=2995304 RepID=A0ABY7GWQ8_9BACT|nr:hypothetical protein [Nannocystis poenicansa]WAS91421.1 hypothetical protein O0S08_34990 [Nannocystis poenicansa]